MSDNADPDFDAGQDVRDGVDAWLNLVRQRAVKPSDPGDPKPDPSWDGLTRFTDRARRVLALARAAAKELQHEYVGTEHLLVGLAREGGGVAAAVLKDFGLLPEQLVVRTVELLGRGVKGTPPSEAELAGVMARLAELVDEYRANRKLGG